MGMPIAFFEVVSDDHERARKFYSALFDWQVASLDRAEELGGTVLVPPTDLPGDFGRFALLADPDGNPVGLWA
jgi:uncharacterized protein